MAYLVAGGAYNTHTAFERVLYLDFPAAERAGRFLPFNVLKGQGTPHTVATNVKEAFQRAWPQLAGGQAPMFEVLVQDGVKVLISNDLPVTALYRLLTDKHFRDGLLARESDPDIVAFFQDQYDRLSERDRADQAGAALRRAHLLTFSPVLKYSLGQADNTLAFRDLLDANRSLIVNLSLGDADSRRLLGCLLSVGLEQAALSRADTPPETRGGPHMLMLDEFSEFSAQSEDALSRMLSLTRKYGLYAVMAHQSWSQASDRLKGGLQNVGIEVAFRLGRADAEYSATVLGRVDPLRVKHQVVDERAAERGHPVFYTLPEQWERWVQAIQDLRPREAFVRLPDGVVQQFTTIAVPDPPVDAERLAAVEAQYLETCFRPQVEIEAELAAYRRPPTPAPTRTSRMRPLPDDTP
ncbi:MAG: hypothetical protein AB7R89_03515 [Dehalococcoidia bacterium]